MAEREVTWDMPTGPICMMIQEKTGCGLRDDLARGELGWVPHQAGAAASAFHGKVQDNDMTWSTGVTRDMGAAVRRGLDRRKDIKVCTCL